MRPPPPSRAGMHVSAQVAAAWSAMNVEHRAATLQSQDRAFLGAMREMQVVRDFVGSPGSILGRTDTKHGEIAEQVYVAVSRASDVLHGRFPSATFDGVPRTSPVDYRVADLDIQSKYYNGLRNTLRGVGTHAEKYPDFASGHGRYHIPRDQHRQLEELRQTGEVEGLADRSAAAIQRGVDDLERVTGRSATDLIEPGEASYDEVQRGRIHDTLKDREDGLARENEDLRDTARDEHGPSLGGLGTAAALGAAAGGGVSLAQAIWVKCREGRNPFQGEFSVEDWEDVGVVAAQGASGGAVAGSAVYVLTNSTSLAAPFAGSMVSALMGIGALLRDYHAGTVDSDQFIEMSHIIAMDAAVAGLAVAAGQTLVPIPILGALLGGLAGKLVAAALQDSLGQSASALAVSLAEYARFETAAGTQLDEECSALLQRLDAWFGDSASDVRGQSASIWRIDHDARCATVPALCARCMTEAVVLGGTQAPYRRLVSDAFIPVGFLDQSLRRSRSTCFSAPRCTLQNAILMIVARGPPVIRLREISFERHGGEFRAGPQ